MIQFVESNQNLKVVFNTDINFETSRSLQSYLDDYTILPEYNLITIDLEKVKFIDSSGVSLFIKWAYPLLEDKSRKVEIVNSSEPVKNILNICQIDKHITVK